MIVLYQHDQAQTIRIQRNIQQIGRQCLCVGSPEALTDACSNHRLAIIDLEMPGQCGFDICHRLRSLHPQLSLIAVTTVDSETDQILALELGADDVITLPCHDRAFQARIKVQLRRAVPFPTCGDTVSGNAEKRFNRESTSLIQCGKLQLNVTCHTASVDGEQLSLTATEFALLRHFVENPDQVFTRNQLLDAVWGHQLECYEHTVVSHINRLRAKLSSEATVAAMLETVRGVGYRFTRPVTTTASSGGSLPLAAYA